MKKEMAMCLTVVSLFSGVYAYAEDTEYDDAINTYSVFEEDINFKLFGASDFGNYPEHTVLTSVPTKFSSTVAPGASPAENVFYITNEDGTQKSFVLLDKDDEGNYFVITEQEYGTHWFTSMTADEINKADVADSEWDFNPENPKSIAYWLNNDFYNNGNGSANMLPQEIKNNIITADWQIENCFTEARVSSKSVSAEEYAAYQGWIANKGQLRTVTAKISLMSYTEYKAYQSKISAVKTRTINSWAGFMTRTVKAKASMSNGAVEYANNFLHICGSNSNQAFVSLNVDGNMADWCQNAYAVRPVFWLDKDFFKNAKIDVNKSGKNVIDLVKEYSYEDLEGIYDDNELLVLGIDTSLLPAVSNVFVSGLRVPGAIGNVAYDYQSAVGANEGKTLFEQYIADSKDGQYSLYKKDSVLKFDNEAAGKYIKLAIVPKDIDGNSGKRVWSSQILAVSNKHDIAVSDCGIYNLSGDALKNISGADYVRAELKIINPMTEDKAFSASIALYNNDNQLKKIINSEFVAAKGSESLHNIEIGDISIANGDYIKLMVKNNGGKPIYLKIIK